MPRTVRSILLAALGIGVCAPLYADYQTSTPYPGYEAALSRCDSLSDAERARCIVNIRPTVSAAGTPASGVANSEPNAVKPGANRDDEYAEALRECQTMTDATEQQRCIQNAKDHLGRF